MSGVTGLAKVCGLIESKISKCSKALGAGVFAMIVAFGSIAETLSPRDYSDRVDGGASA